MTIQQQLLFEDQMSLPNAVAPSGLDVSSGGSGFTEVNPIQFFHDQVHLEDKFDTEQQMTVSCGFMDSLVYFLSEFWEVRGAWIAWTKLSATIVAEPRKAYRQLQTLRSLTLAWLSGRTNVLYPPDLVELLSCIISIRNPLHVQVALSFLFAWFRVVDPPHRKPRLDGIVAPGPTSPLPFGYDEVILFVTKVFGPTKEFTRVYNTIAKALRWPMSSAKGPNGHALLTAHRDAIALHDCPEIGQYVEQLANGLKLRQWWMSLKQCIQTFGESVRADHHIQDVHSRITLVTDKRGKTRYVGVLDYWTQLLLTPLHDTLFHFVSQLDSDYSTRQEEMGRKVQQLQREKVPIAAMDLSQSTNRIPRGFYRLLLTVLFSNGRLGRVFESFWKQRPFTVGQGSYSYNITYGAGMPMGAKSSFPLLCLFSHFVVRLAALPWYPGMSYWHYMVCGDDIVIYGDHAHHIYSQLNRILETLGVPRNASKSSQTGTPVIQTLSRYFWNGLDLGLLPGKLLWKLAERPRLGANLAAIWSERACFPGWDSFGSLVLAHLPTRVGAYWEAGLATPTKRNLRQNKHVNLSIKLGASYGIRNERLRELWLFIILKKWRLFDAKYLQLITYLMHFAWNPDRHLVGRERNPWAMLRKRQVLTWPFTGVFLMPERPKTAPVPYQTAIERITVTAKGGQIGDHPMVRASLEEFHIALMALYSIFFHPRTSMEVLFNGLMDTMSMSSTEMWNTACGEKSDSRPFDLTLGMMLKQISSVLGSIHRNPTRSVTFALNKLLPSFTLTWHAAYGLSAKFFKHKIVTPDMAKARTTILKGFSARFERYAIPPDIKKSLRNLQFRGVHDSEFWDTFGLQDGWAPSVIIGDEPLLTYGIPHELLMETGDIAYLDAYGYITHIDER